MDIRQIKTFVYVAELKSFTRASAFLHISQPALSRQIRLLEEEVDVKLFLRSGHGVVLTEQGQTLLEHCVGFLNQFDSLRNAFNDYGLNGSAEAGHVTIGLPVPATRFIGQRMLNDLKVHHPGISLKIAEGFNPLIHEWLLSGSIDLAILYGPLESTILRRQLLAVEELYAITAASEKNLSRTTITSQELLKGPLILPHRPHILRTIVDEIAVNDVPIIEVNAITLMFELASANQGYAILPGNSLNHAIAAGDVVALKIIEPVLSWDVSIWHSSLQELSEPALIVRQLVHDEVVSLIREGRWSAHLAGDIKD